MAKHSSWSIRPPRYISPDQRRSLPAMSDTLPDRMLASPASDTPSIPLEAATSFFRHKGDI
jgi:hypothetical protein